MSSLMMTKSHKFLMMNCCWEEKKIHNGGTVDKIKKKSGTRRKCVYSIAQEKRIFSKCSCAGHTSVNSFFQQHIT